MAKPFSMGDVAVDVAVRQELLPEPDLIEPPVAPDEPFRILILGNFSGRGDGKTAPIEVDRDNLDEILSRLHVWANISFANGAYPLPLRAMEDFEPDRIARSYDLFRGLAEASAANPLKSETKEANRGRDPEMDVRRLYSTSLVDEILEKQDGRQQPSVPEGSLKEGGDDLQSIINRAIEPYLAKHDPGATGRSEELRRKQELLMRAVLRDKCFRVLEANWRSLDFLVRRLETDESLKLYLFDISKENLASELVDNPDAHSGATYRAVVGEPSMVGITRWAVIVGLFEFDRDSRRDVELLRNMGLLARAARAPFLAESVPDKQDEKNNSEAWQALRESSYASWLGLGLPRFLLRLPYGKDTVPIERFPFEEMPGRPEHQFYLWGNPAVACAYLLGASFAKAGWNFRPGLEREIGDLPLHVFHADGAARTQPCAEILMSEKSLEELLDSGLMPLASERNRDIIRLVRFQSIADPPAPLSGRWV